MKVKLHQVSVAHHRKRRRGSSCSCCLCATCGHTCGGTAVTIIWSIIESSVCPCSDQFHAPCRTISNLQASYKVRNWTWPPLDQVTVQHQLTLVSNLQQQQLGVCSSHPLQPTSPAATQQAESELIQDLFIWDYHEFSTDSNNMDICTVQGFYFVQLYVGFKTINNQTVCSINLQSLCIDECEAEIRYKLSDLIWINWWRTPSVMCGVTVCIKWHHTLWHHRPHHTTSQEPKN